jgi:hypothetical protein
VQYTHSRAAAAAIAVISFNGQSSHTEKYKEKEKKPLLNSFFLFFDIKLRQTFFRVSKNK